MWIDQKQACRKREAAKDVQRIQQLLERRVLARVLAKDMADVNGGIAPGETIVIGTYPDHTSLACDANTRPEADPC